MRIPVATLSIVGCLVPIGLVAGLVYHNSAWIAVALIAVTAAAAWAAWCFARPARCNGHPSCNCCLGPGLGPVKSVVKGDGEGESEDESEDEPLPFQRGK